MNTKRIKGFKAVFCPKPKILILGTLPGPASLKHRDDTKQEEYYCDSRNAFWKVIAALKGEDAKTLNYRAKKKILREYHIAIWDICESAERESAADSKIKNEIYNPIFTSLKKHPTIKKVVFNGKSGAVWRRFKRVYKKEMQLAKDNDGVDFIPLDFTTNRCGFEKLKEEWLPILQSKA